MYIERQSTAEICTLAGEFPVVAILGPRQSGKTSLARHIFDNYNYVSFENPDIAEAALSDPRGFLHLHVGKFTIFDEIQKVPHLLSYLQEIVDSERQTARYVLTGSQNLLLHKQVSQTLAGRVGIMRLMPLSATELRAGRQVPPDPETLLFTGGYPRIYDHNIRPATFFREYVETYVQRDIRDLLNIKDYRQFVRFTALVAGRSGQLLNIQSLADDAGINRKTVDEWLSVLEVSYLTFQLQPYHNNFSKRIRKQPKLYFWDTGLLCYLLGIRTPQDLWLHPLRGAIFETFVVGELRKADFGLGLDQRFYFWRDSQGHEVDLIVEQGNNLRAVEIKSGKTFGKDQLQGLKYWQKISGAAVETMQLVYAGDEDHTMHGIPILSWNSL